MTALPTATARLRAAALLILLALAPLWLVLMYGRGLWTPDEPREADIAWRMSHQPERALPQLAGTPFLEKPPLSYWLAAGAERLLGDSPAAARAPNFLYALTGALALGALALACGTATAPAALAAVVAFSALTALRVSIWLAPDACLLAGCALALLGAALGYRAPPGARKAGGYALMHFGAAIGFMAKSAPGWLVPALALFVLIGWERRGSELARWELYAGFALQALVIGPWLAAVLRTTEGADALRALFWHNVVGRFTRVAAPAALDYTRGHPNTPGKYLAELPLYLLPWTFLAAAALARAWHRVRAPDGTAWRYAVAASLPLLALLSLAATARDIYAAPALLGFGLLTGLWAEETRRAPTPFDLLAVRLTGALVGVIALACATILAMLAAAREAALAPCIAAALAVVAAAGTALSRGARACRADRLLHAVAWSYGGYAAVLCVTALLVLPVVDRWQDLPGLAHRIRADTAQRPLALLNPDETTIAILDHGYGAPELILTPNERAAHAAVREWLASHGADARILVLLPGHAPGRLTQWLAPYHRFAPAGDGIAGALAADGGVAVRARYELPQGRRYALLGAAP